MCRRYFKTMDYYNRIHQPRRPTKKEFEELCEFEYEILQETRRKIGHSSVDEGDLAHMLDTASIAVFDNFNTITTPPRAYSGKLMVVIWGLRSTAVYVWINGKLVEVTEANRAEIV